MEKGLHHLVHDVSLNMSSEDKNNVLPGWEHSHSFHSKSSENAQKSGWLSQEQLKARESTTGPADP